MKSSWKLKGKVGEETQGIVTSGFGRLEHGIALFLELPDGRGGAWLADLQKNYPVTAASETGGSPLPQAVSIALTWTGLKQMGLPEAALSSFSTPFREGMLQEDRLRRLGDRRKSEWLDTVLSGGPIWSGNTPIEKRDAPEGAYDVSLKAEDDSNVETQIETEKTVHAMLLFYVHTVEEVRRTVAKLKKDLAKHKVKIVHDLPLVLDVDEGKTFSREHFGFADGISQPIPYDEEGSVTVDGKKVESGDPVHGVRLGEILIGHKNGHQEHAPGPVVAQSNANLLPQHPQAIGFGDLGINGSYMVVRQLRQDVAAFWQGMEKAAKTVQAQDPKATHVDAKWVAEKVVGRGMDGRALLPGGKRIEHEPGGVIRNDFKFFDDDQFGLGCPLGSHVRRANPRDSLAPKESMKQTLLDAANNHRILRRARKYGPKLANRIKDDGKERGLLFMCLNTDIARQFEFTQQTWLFNTDFSTLFEETDPLIGPDGAMTIPEDPLRRRVNVQTFVKLVGGEYFFLPSIPALTYLASL